MPYAPYRRGPFAVTVAALVSLTALVSGIVLLTGHHPVRGVVLLAAAGAAAIVATVSRRR